MVVAAAAARRAVGPAVGAAVWAAVAASDPRPGRCEASAGATAGAASAVLEARHERACSLILQHLLGGNTRGSRGGRQHQQPQQPASPATTASGERVARWLRRTAPGVECRDGLGRSALAVAAMGGDVFAAEALLAAGYDANGLDANHLTPLSYAAWKGHADVARLLLLHGAQPLYLDNFGVSPLHKAAAFGRPLLLSQLLRACPDPTTAVNLRTGPVRAPPSYEAISQHQTPLHLALRPGAANITPDTRRELVALLLGFGADPNVRDVKGDSALHYACRLGDPFVVWALLAQGGADPQAPNEAGETPLGALPWHALFLAPLLLLPAAVWGGKSGGSRGGGQWEMM